MNDREYKGQKARVKALVKKWVLLLGLTGWRIDCEYERHERPTEGIDENASWLTAADTKARWQYEYAVIRFFVPSYESRTDEAVEEIVLHELLHVMVNPLRDTTGALDKNEDVVVTRLARAFLQSRLIGPRASSPVR